MTLEDAVRRAEGERWLASPGGQGEATPTEAASVAIGPEGGWSPREMERLLGAGFRPLGLGPWILRTPTAVAVALGALSY